jgi:ATP-dependent protease HslVU (ClpYQ) peptidase subunit
MTVMIGDAKRMIIVTDSQVSDEDSNSKNLNVDKVFEIPEGYIGGAGDWSSIQKVVEWYKNGKKDKDKPDIHADNDADFMVLNEDGIFISDKSLEFYKIDKQDGIGCGQNIALGAIRLGHTVEDAVWAACQVDLYSGGDIKVYSLNKKPTIYHKKS